MIEHRFTQRELRIEAWLLVAPGLAAAAVALADLLGGHALGLFRSVRAVGGSAGPGGPAARAVAIAVPARDDVSAVAISGAMAVDARCRGMSSH
jgi:hypothetical protein